MPLFAANVLTAICVLNVKLGESDCVQWDQYLCAENDIHRIYDIHWDRSTCPHVVLYNYAWPGFNGVWTMSAGEDVNGAPLYRRSYNGKWWYLWREEAFGSRGIAIGGDPAVRDHWGWKWGDSLFAGDWWYKDTNHQWHREFDAGISCRDEVALAKAPTIGPDADRAVPPTETSGVGLDGVPPISVGLSSAAVAFPFGWDIKTMWVIALSANCALCCVMVRCGHCGNCRKRKNVLRSERRVGD